MSEILAKHRRTIERLQSHNNFRFDIVSWSCDGHECPSYRNRSSGPSNCHSQSIGRRRAAKPRCLASVLLRIMRKPCAHHCCSCLRRESSRRGVTGNYGLRAKPAFGLLPLRLAFVPVCIQVGGNCVQLGIRQSFASVAEHRHEMSDLVRLIGISDVAIRTE